MPNTTGDSSPPGNISEHQHTYDDDDDDFIGFIPECLKLLPNDHDSLLSHVHAKGCVEAVSEYLISHVTIIAYAGLAFIAAQMLAVFLAFKFRHLATKVGLNTDF